jgi:hypothetical protein
MRSRILFSLFFFPSLFVFAQDPPQIESTVILVGDCGEPVIRDSPLGEVLRREAAAGGKNTTVIYLGDNVYPFGLPAEGHLFRSRGEEVLKIQAGWVSGLEAQGIFIPGNHDWQHWNRSGWEFILNQQEFIDSLHMENVSLFPKGGCPGPIEFHLSKNSVLLVIDSQWILHAYDKPGEESDCFAKDPTTLMILLEDAMIRNRGKRVIIAAHHPVISYGDHGGVFTLQDHIFPLVDLERHLYIPFPVVGSLYPLYRSVLGHPQDIKHPHYSQYSKLIQRMLAHHPGSIYAAGHEHALEHIVRDSVHYIISGSGSKTTYVKKGKYAHYAKGVRGFVKVVNYTNGTALLEFWQADKEYPEGHVVHRESLVSVKSLLEKDEKPIDMVDRTIKVRASNQYRSGKTRSWFFGANYRRAWETEVEVPVFYLGREKGGLKILQKGGGMQTISLRVADSLGREYVLRSVDKNPEGAVPEMFRNTFAQDLVQDQISASHPYAALIIPPLAEAAGIYHTNPRLVYVPDDPALGLYRKDFANTLAVFEERPADDWSDMGSFGNSRQIINTSKVLERLFRDADHRVDQHFVARSRIFDLWIGDWDRHDDQWRWSTFEDGKNVLYRPIPRDRDQAFFVNDGILPRLWSRRWAMPKLEGFDDKIHWVPGLAFNARFFDRSFLNELEEKDWIRQAKELQDALTDEVIEKAVRQWPSQIFALNGPEVIAKLKARRETLADDARELYTFLSKQVDVVGSNKDERFEVERKTDGDVEVKLFKVNKQGEKGKKVFSRDFKFRETKEIHLYGLGGEDQFIITGTAPRSIRIRVIGGNGKDSINDQSHVDGPGRSTIFYDNAKVNAIASKGELKDRTSSDPNVNQYNRKAFKYNRLAPLVYSNFNPDDGLFIGGGFLYQTEGFRKNPYKTRHIFVASVAPRTNSYNILYRGDFTDVIGRWGIALDADLKAPNYVNNFFGLGNETVFLQNLEDDPNYDVDEEIDYYRFRFQEIKLEGLFTRRLLGSSRFSIGPALQRIEVEEPSSEDRFISEFAKTIPYNIFEEQHTYAGVTANLIIDNRNDPKLTTRGAYVFLGGRTMKGLDERASDFRAFETALSLYHSFSAPRGVVFAGRIGGGWTSGDYDFYQAQVLSGRTELRGYRKTRFYGDRKVYANMEVRAKLFSVRTYLFPATVGLVGFHDTGRVWYRDDSGIDPSAGGESNKWHKGWGGGLWFTPFNLSVLSVEVGHSEEGTLGYVRLGFLF